MTAALEARGLGAAAAGVRILQDIRLSVEPGEWVAVIGPNGAGKSTLLRALAGIAASTGEVRMAGRPIAEMGRREVARVVALVPQQPHIPEELTVAEYVLLGRTPYIGYLGFEGRADRLAAERTIVRLGLRRFVARRLGSLSGGELQRVILARALAQDAPVLLLDEPTSALDLGRQQLVMELVDRLRRESRLAVISAMHDLSLAAQYADRLLLLDRGRVVAEGAPGDVLTEEVVARLYGADVRVLRERGSVFVLPHRREVRI